MRALKGAGFKVSVDSGNVDELRRGAQAGADYVLSLDETTLDAIDGTAACRCWCRSRMAISTRCSAPSTYARAKGIAHIADPVLDPIHFGFMTSLERYAELRRQRPDVEILMGTGNLTELTDADSQGVTAMLIGICSELKSATCSSCRFRRTRGAPSQEHDAARRLMYRAREDESLPKGYGDGLFRCTICSPYPRRREQIAEARRGARPQLPHRGRRGRPAHLQPRRPPRGAMPFELFDKLGVEADGAHAFYLGYELAKAEIARSLGKRYTQDVRSTGAWPPTARPRT